MRLERSLHRRFRGGRTASIAWPGSDEPQPDNPPPPRTPSQLSPRAIFSERMRELGFVEQKNLEIRQFTPKSSTSPADLEATIRQAVRWKPDLICVRSVADTRIAQKVTTEVPIVFSWVGDPVAAGLVQAMARPGGNSTGVSFYYEGLAVKRLELAREIVPKARRIGVIFDGRTFPGPIKTLEDLRRAASATGLSLEEIDIAAGESGVQRALDRFAGSRPDALLPVGIIYDTRYLERLLDFQGRARIPIVEDFVEAVEGGILLGLFEDQRDHFRRAADVAAKVLRGAKPASVPVNASTRINLVVNAKTAKAIGITLPQSVLARADRVIE